VRWKECLEEPVRPGASTPGNGSSLRRLILHSLATFDVNHVPDERDAADRRLVSVLDDPGGTLPVIAQRVEGTEGSIE